MLNRSVCVYLHALKLNFCALRYIVLVQLLVNQDPELAPKATLALLFSILASGNSSRGAQIGRPCPLWAYLGAQLSSGLAHPRLRL